VHNFLDMGLVIAVLHFSLLIRAQKCAMVKTRLGCKKKGVGCGGSAIKSSALVVSFN
jgi:hypothetical protein